MDKFDFKPIEKKWANNWFKDNIYKAKDFDKKPKKYILAELPYPSGKSLHIGHMMRYTVPEIYSRFLRMQGFNVMFPMGWDAFGLPAEVYAQKENITPQEAISAASKDYKLAMQAMGYGIDWGREINTSDPNYYKWTQWIFLKLWKNGLALQKQMPVWFAPELGTLADEEIVTNQKGEKVSEKGGHKVSRVLRNQWVLKIPEYAEKLLGGLNDVDFPSAIKQAQAAWIGKKEGINIEYKVKNTEKTITCFTTRPDTNFGATFIVLAPEHPFAHFVASHPRLNRGSIQKIKSYIKKSVEKSDLERVENKEKTGVFTGLYAINALNNDELPIWISDFVLPHFGTGAVVGVPGHDQRDFEFAKKFNLPVKKVIDSKEEVFEGEGKVINSGFLNGLTSRKALTKIINHLEKKGWGARTTTYSMRDQVWSRQRYWGDPIPLIHTADGAIEADYDLPVEIPKINKTQISPNGFPPLSEFKNWSATKDSKGKKAKRETDTMPTWAGSNWYFLRYIDPKNSKAFGDSKKLGYWLPVDKYFGGAEHTTVHLLYSRFWHKFLYDEGLVPTSEPYKWRLNGGLMLGPDGHKMSKSRGNVINPQAILNKFGADATRAYIAFLGPYEGTYPWNDSGIESMHKFVSSLHNLRHKVTPAKPDKKTLKRLHQLLINSEKMLKSLKINTTISQIMIFTNHLKTLDKIPEEIWKDFIKVLAPIMPFLAEELWQEINGYKKWVPNNSVHLQPWPKADKNLASEKTLNIPIQINGKLRATLTVNKNATQEEIKSKALKNANIKVHLKNKKIKKFIYIPQKIVNIVV